MNRRHIKDTLNKSSVLLYTTVQLPVHTVRFVHACERQCCEVNAEEAAARDRLSYERWERSPAALLSSLPFPPFLLTCAVRGDINLSDRLCDPPSRRGGRRSAVNINILPGFMADMEQPRPP